jgi:hypothetical protein
LLDADEEDGHDNAPSSLPSETAAKDTHFFFLLLRKKERE